MRRPSLLTTAFVLLPLAVGCQANRTERVRHGALTSTLPATIDQAATIEVANRSMTIAFAGLDARTWEGAVAASFTPRTAAGVVSNNIHSYVGAAADTDVVHELLADRHVIRLTLRRAPALDGLDGYVEWALSTNDKSGDVWAFDRTSMLDGALAIDDFKIADTKVEHSLLLRVVDGDVRLQVPLAWLASGDRAYPVTFSAAFVATAFGVTSRGVSGCIDTMCENGNPCTIDRCDAAGMCEHVATNDGQGCWGNGVCSAGSCSFAGSVACVDSQCKDGNPCTIDGCDAAGLCANNATNEGQSCWDTGTCRNGSCEFDASGPACEASWCEDGNPCTADACNATGGCHHWGVNDGQTCWENGLCSAGQCIPITHEICGADQCNDGNPCTADSCSAGNCTNAATNQGHQCWTTGSCDNGFCVFSSSPPTCVDSWCEDGNPCTSDVCSANGANCEHPETNYGQPCWGTGMCAGGVCVF